MMDYMRQSIPDQGPETAPTLQATGDPMPSPPKDVVLSKEKIGERVRTFREQRGLSQGKLAKLLGTQPQNISQIERGIRGISLQQVIRYARALEISSDQLLGETRPVTPVQADRKMVLRLQRLQRLPPAQRKAVLKLLDGALGLHQAA